MTDISTSCAYYLANNSFHTKCVLVDAPNTTDGTDTIAITLANYGITTFLGCLSFIHSTEASVITLETSNAGTTAVVAGVLTITVVGGTNKRRSILVFGL